MKRLLHSIPALMLALLFMAPVAVFAQDDDAAEQTEEPKLETIEEYMTAWEESLDAYRMKAREARGDREKMMELRKEAPDPADYAGPVMELIKEDPASEESRDALIWTMGLLRRPNQRAEIVEMMLEHHGESEELINIVPGIPSIDPENVEEALMNVVDTNPHASVQAAAVYTLYRHLDRTRKDADDVDAVDAKLEELKTTLIENYGEEADARGVTYLARMEAVEFQKQLEIGSAVPDIEGEDIDGVAFKLSDYKGKVIVLDFWGHW